MSLHHYCRSTYPESFNSKRGWLYSFLYFLQHFLLSFFKFFIFLHYFPRFDLGRIDSPVKPLRYRLLTLVALGLLESKHIFQTAFVNTVIAVPKHDTQPRLFNTHTTVGALGVLCHLRLKPLSFLLSCDLLITASKKFGKWDCVSSVFKWQQ